MSDDIEHKEDEGEEDGESPHARDKFDWATAGEHVHVLRAEDDEPAGDDDE